MRKVTIEEVAEARKHQVNSVEQFQPGLYREYYMINPLVSSDIEVLSVDAEAGTYVYKYLGRDFVMNAAHLSDAGIQTNKHGYLGSNFLVPLTE